MNSSLYKILGKGEIEFLVLLWGRLQILGINNYFFSLFSSKNFNESCVLWQKKKFKYTSTWTYRKVLSKSYSWNFAASVKVRSSENWLLTFSKSKILKTNGQFGPGNWFGSFFRMEKLQIRYTEKLVKVLHSIKIQIFSFVFNSLPLWYFSSFKSLFGHWQPWSVDLISLWSSMTVTYLDLFGYIFFLRFHGALESPTILST